MKSILVVTLAAALAGCAASRPDLPTEKNVDLARYVGTWYEQARLPNRFQQICAGDVQADYTLEAGGTIRVVNRCRTRDGQFTVAEGEARLSAAASPPDPARLQVRFAPAWLSWLPMVWGDYWIVKLEGDYQYSLVGTPDRKYLWVLSREKKADARVVASLLETAKSLGFDVGQVVVDTQ